MNFKYLPHTPALVKRKVSGTKKLRGLDKLLYDSSKVGAAMDNLIDKAAEKLANAANAVALTGAGISTESGIPDFRSPGGLWERVDPEEFTIDRFMENPARFWRLHLRLKRSGEFNIAAAPPKPRSCGSCTPGGACRYSSA